MIPGGAANLAVPHPERRVPIVGLAGTPVELRVQDSGHGRPLVFLNGLVGQNHHWDPVVTRLHGRCRCVRTVVPFFNLRGEDCTLRGVTVILQQFLREHFAGGDGSGKPILVGTSFGGHAALHIALETPELLGGLVLVGSAGLKERSFETGFNLRRTRDWLREFFSSLFHDPAKHLNEDELEEAYQQLMNRQCARAMLHLSRSSQNDNLSDRVHLIRAPTLLIWGRHDVVTPPDAAEEFAAKLPDARLAWMEQSGHAPMVENPVEFAAAIREFLDELDRRGRDGPARR
jgi:pimeloyl-ACP methyl ester carboxylesterase